jgi:hypothetical protein
MVNRLPPCAPKWLLLHRNNEQHDSVYISSRTCVPHSLLHEPSRYHPMANSKPAFLFAEYEFQTSSIPPFLQFQSGFKPSLTIARFGRFCCERIPSSVPLGHFPLNPPPLSSARSCGRHDWRSHGPHSIYELCRTSRSHLMARPQETSKILTLLVGDGSSCVNRGGGLCCMTLMPMSRHMSH